MIFVSRPSWWKWWERASSLDITGSYYVLVACVPGPEVQSTSLGAAACVTQMHVLQHVASLNYHLCKYIPQAIIKCDQIMYLLAATPAFSQGSQHLLGQSCCLVRIDVHDERMNVKCSCLTSTPWPWRSPRKLLVLPVNLFSLSRLIIWLTQVSPV